MFRVLSLHERLKHLSVSKPSKVGVPEVSVTACNDSRDSKIFSPHYLFTAFITSSPCFIILFLPFGFPVSSLLYSFNSLLCSCFLCLLHVIPQAVCSLHSLVCFWPLSLTFPITPTSPSAQRGTWARLITAFSVLLDNLPPCYSPGHIGSWSFVSYVSAVTFKRFWAYVFIFCF